MKVLVTGANGFVGCAIMSRLLATRGIEVVGTVRDGARGPSAAFSPGGVARVVPGDLAADTDWSSVLRGIDTVVHTAARVHLLQERGSDALPEYRKVNVQGSLRLAQQAAAAGVRRFVFISSVKVNGEATKPGQAFTPADAPAPADAYGLSKWEAEQALWKLVRAGAGMELVVIRPPLVYGVGVKANFAALLHAVQRGWPLPLGAIDNRRSFLGMDNLVDFVFTCILHEKAANQTFLVCDGQDLSTPELVRAMARAANVRARLWSVPVWVLQACAKLVGRADMVQRLCGDLQLDMSLSRQLLGWSPRVSVDEGLRRLVIAHRES